MAQAPGEQSEVFFTKDKNYAHNVILVCDHERRVIFYNLLWPGSVHDSRIYRNTQPFQHPERYFSEGQYFLGDAGFAIGRNTVIPYLKTFTFNI